MVNLARETTTIFDGVSRSSKIPAKTLRAFPETLEQFVIPYAESARKENAGVFFAQAYWIV